MNTNTEQRVAFSETLLKKYDQTGPRYTSYPTALQFSDEFQRKHYLEIAQGTSLSQPEQPLSLYFHIPFCDTICYYCGCNKIVTRNRDLAPIYLQHLHREIDLQSALFNNRKVKQLHLGGGTPTFLSISQMTDLMTKARESFNLDTSDGREFSIEIDPRSIDPEGIEALSQIGFNRLSLGVQDFDLAVQKAVNRIQSEQQTESVLSTARAHGFSSVSIDLIYGLPKQSTDSFTTTLDKVISLNPDRIAVYNYAHLPHLFKTQRGIKEHELPSSDTKMAILSLTIEKLTKAGYVYIGMDHFAKPDDELAIAQRTGHLHRNFQGYSTHADCDLVGMGLTSIGKVGHSYSQNYKDIESYYYSLENNQLPIFRGIELDYDDILRRHVINELMCHSRLEFAAIEQTYAIDFKHYFAYAIDALAPFVSDGLVVVEDNLIQITPVGRMLMRNIAMQFDAYLQPEAKSAQRASYSRLI